MPKRLALLSVVVLAIGAAVLSAPDGARRAEPAGARRRDGETARAKKPASAPAACRLDIANRLSAAGSPKEGWCGEATIQMAALHYGAWFPQRVINRAGRPKHPDLYAQDIATALKGLSLSYAPWAPPRGAKRDLPAFLAWLRARIKLAGCVFVGVKIHPTRHDNWILDHFVLAVGYTGDSLIYNSNTRAGQVTRTFKLMSSMKGGYSFANRFNRYFAYAITGFARPAGDVPVRLTVAKQTADKLQLRIHLRSLQVGKRYRLLRFSSAADAVLPAFRRSPPTAAETFTATAAARTITRTIRPKDTAVYRCIRQVP